MEYYLTLHHNKKLFKQAIQASADLKNIKAIYVEKDYWVTYALYTIYKDAINNDTVFKGGTSLSKCFNSIDRFSEDIDLVVLRHAGESDSKLGAKIKKISKVVANVLPEIDVEGLTQKRGMNRKTAHTYNKEFDGDYGQVREFIVVEATWLGNYEPYVTRQINSFVGQMMMDTQQEAIALQYGLTPFEMKVLEPTRTICEKIMSLVRFSYTTNALEDLKKKIRHVYDLHQLLSQKEFIAYFISDAFETMLLKVANDDVASYKNNNEWLAFHPNQSMLFKDLDSSWKQLESAYTITFKAMVYGALPLSTEILSTLQMIKDRMETIKWDIQINN